MCGRYYIDMNHEEVVVLLHKLQESQPTLDLTQLAQKEVFPSQSCLVMVGQEDLAPSIMKWGYRKWNNKGILINARSETIDTSMFHHDIHTRRCGVVTSGFYEWDQAKKKHFVTGNEPILYLAGVFRTDPKEPFPTFAILTKASEGNMREIHPRSPLILTKKGLALWQSEQFQTLLKP